MREVWGIGRPFPYAPPPDFAPPLDDAATYALYGSGELGLEYFWGKSWLRRYARWLKPTTFDDLTALFLPWNMPDFRHERLAEYIRRRLGKDKPVAIIPELEPFLRDACGLLIYREQAAKILHHIGGCPMDIAIRCVPAFITWGIKGLLKSTDFVAGANRHGYSAETIENIVSLLNDRLATLVIKSWCASQALASYQAVYLKAHGI